MKTKAQPKDKIYLDSAENSQFQAVLESLGEGITFSDAEGKFLVYNLRMQEITGFTQDEANNSGDFTRLLYPDSLERQKALQRLKEITEHKVVLPLEVETAIQAKDGTKKVLWVSTRAMKFKDRDMFLSIYRDITQRKLQEEELKKAKEKLEIQTWGLERANTGIKVLYKELEQRTEEIKESEERFKAIFDTANDGILVAEPETKKFFLGNKRICQMLGYSLEELKNLKVNDIHPPKDLPFILGEFEKKAKKEVAITDNLSMLRKDGSIFYVDISSSFVVFGGKIYLLGIFKDITERKEIDEMKNKLVSTVSHELRTPLATIKNTIAILLDIATGPINDNQRKFLDMAKSNIDRLSRLIDDLLDISKLETGKMEFKRVLVDFSTMLRESCAKWKMEVDKNCQRLECCLPDLPVNIYIDPDKLTQILDNLISNAIKFTPREGKINIELKDRKDQIEVSVSDTGIGIAKKDLPKAFNRFQQFNRTPAPGYKGTGLGLAIAKELIEMLKGEIKVESELNKGTKFIFTLPKIEAEEIFEEYITNGLKEAADRKSSLSLIVARIAEFSQLQEKWGEKPLYLLTDIERVIKGYLRSQADTVLRATGELIILLSDTRKENAEVVKKRIEEMVRTYLAQSKEEWIREIRITLGSATFPDEANNHQELLDKANAGGIKIQGGKKDYHLRGGNLR